MNLISKIFLTSALLVVCCLNSSFGQEIDGIYVEVFHTISAEEAKLDPDLKEGAKCYRIYADLGSNTYLQAIFGSERHPLKIETTTEFYNSVKGSSTGDRINPELIKIYPEIEWDSWVTINSATLDHAGIPLVEDSDGSIYSEEGKDGLMPNANYIAVSPHKLSLAAFLKNGPNAFEVNDGALAVWGDVKGDNQENRVLIAQITTDGELSFEINLQVRDADGFVQKFVAKNPLTDEKVINDLIYPEAK